MTPWSPKLTRYMRNVSNQKIKHALELSRTISKSRLTSQRAALFKAKQQRPIFNIG